MAKEKILDSFIAARPSNQKFITRYHNTRFPQIKSILEDFKLKSVYGDPIYTTSSRYDWTNAGMPVQIEFKIPKDYYKENIVDNPVYPIETVKKYSKRYGISDWDAVRKHLILPAESSLVGGRVSNFNELPLDFANRICVENRNGEIPCYYVGDFYDISNEAERNYMNRTESTESLSKYYWDAMDLHPDWVVDRSSRR